MCRMPRTGMRSIASTGAQYPVMIPLHHSASFWRVWLIPFGYKEQILAAVKYDLRPRNPELPPVRYGMSNGTADYVFHTPTPGLLIGALTGWLLATILVIIRAQRQGRQPWVSIFTAGVGCIVLTLLLRYGAGIQLPITVGVNDFYGALFVGLLSHRFAGPLLDWLGIGDAKPSTDREPLRGERAEQEKPVGVEKQLVP